MDLPRLEALAKHWKKNPPVHITMAAKVGWGRSEQAASTDTDSFLASAPYKDIRPT